MAARFRVGAGGNWSDTGHWSTTSGGASGAAAPTSLDDVTFDSGCSGTTTIDVAAVGLSLTMNNAAVTLINDGSHGITITNAVTHTTGAINTNGQAFSWGSYSASNSNSRTLTITGSSGTITGNGIVWDCNVVTNLTVNASGCTITLPNTNDYTFRGGTGKSYGTLTVTQCNSISFATSPTYATVNVTGRAVVSNPVNVFNNFTVTGTLTVAGNTTQGVNRLFVQSDTAGTTRTITAGAVTIAGDVIFMDIAFPGSPTWTNAGSAYVGDAGGNTGITATVSATQAWQLTTSGSWSTTANWTSRVPLPQDDVTISKAFSAGQTITANMPYLGRSIDFTGTTGNPTMSRSTTTASYGSLKLVAGMTFSGGSAMSLRGRGAFTITMAGVTWNGGSPTINAPGGTYTLQDDFAGAGLQTLSFQAGSFNANNHNVSVGSVFNTSSIAKTITCGTGTWTLRDVLTIWSLGNATLSAGSATFDITDSSSTSKTFVGGGLSYGTLRYISTGAGGLTLTGSNSFVNLRVEATTARTLTLPAGGTQSVTGSLILQGASGQNLSLVSSSPGTATAIRVTSCSGTYTHSNLTQSADVSVTVAICGPSSPMPVEAPTTLRSPRVVAVPGEEAPPTLLSRIQGCVVALVLPAFNSTDSHPLNYAIFSLDDGTANNRVQAVWGAANTWQVRRIGGAGTDLTPTVADSFLSGTRRLVAMAWDATKNYISANGGAFVSGVATGFPTSVSHLMLGRGALGSASGDFFNGTVVWLAGFSAPLADADVAALEAAFVNVDPQFQQLPGSPTFLYTAATGVIVTSASSAQSGSLALESLAGLTASAADPFEALASAAASTLDPFESLLSASGDSADPFEALAAPISVAEEPYESTTTLAPVAALEPFEALVSASMVSDDPLEALGGVTGDAGEPYEALGQLIVDATEPYESESSASKDALMPWESRGVPQRGKAVGATRRTSAAEGETARTSSIVNVKGV